MQDKYDADTSVETTRKEDLSAHSPKRVVNFIHKSPTKNETVVAKQHAGLSKSNLSMLYHNLCRQSDSHSQHFDTSRMAEADDIHMPCMSSFESDMSVQRTAFDNGNIRQPPEQAIDNLRSYSLLSDFSNEENALVSQPEAVRTKWLNRRQSASEMASCDKYKTHQEVEKQAGRGSPLRRIISSIKRKNSKKSDGRELDHSYHLEQHTLGDRKFAKSSATSMSGRFSRKGFVSRRHSEGSVAFFTPKVAIRPTCPVAALPSLNDYLVDADEDVFGPAVADELALSFRTRHPVTRKVISESEAKFNSDYAFDMPMKRMNNNNTISTEGKQ